MREIIHEIDEWSERGEPVAIATVIETWGSSPRAIGAKMALTPNHHIAGSVSGGCVEGAVFEAGVETLESGQSRLLRFGVADETAFESVGLACGGTIEVFVEPLTPALREFWRDAFTQDVPITTATIVRGPRELIGSKLMLDSDGRVQTSGVFADPRSEAKGTRTLQVYEALLDAARVALREGTSRRITPPTWRIQTPSPQPPLPEEEGSEAFVEVILPKPTLIIVGAVHIAITLTTMAKALGYRVIVVDPRSAFGNEDRFPHADRLVKESPDKAFTKLPITRSTSIVTLTHDARFDDPALKIALRSPAFYVGALGGRKTRAARRERLMAAGTTEAQMNRLHAPIGIDIGTTTPEEIALATMAQIIAARNRVDHA